MSSARRVLVVAVVALACGSSDAPTTYGDIAVEVRAADGDAAATFADTITIVATVAYGPCLDEFYREHEDDAFTGEDGKDAAAEWKMSLCEPADPEQPDDTAIACEVIALEQRLGGASGLVATYAVTGTLADRQLPLGPFPDEDSASCRGGALPSLHVGADALVGRDADEIAIWTARPLEDSVAVVDQNAPVVVYASRLAPP